VVFAKVFRCRKKCGKISIKQYCPIKHISTKYWIWVFGPRIIFFCHYFFFTDWTYFQLLLLNLAVSQSPSISHNILSLFLKNTCTLRLRRSIINPIQHYPNLSYIAKVLFWIAFTNGFLDGSLPIGVYMCVGNHYKGNKVSHKQYFYNLFMIK